MGNTNDKIKKICNFYANDWHFAVMLLPYVNENITKGVKITTIFEESMENNVELLLEKLNLKNKSKILEINWKQKDEIIIRDEIEKSLNESNENLFIVSGSNEYINNVNKIFEEYEFKKLNNKINVMNCFEVLENEKKIDEIIDTHDSLLNTSGEKSLH